MEKEYRYKKTFIFMASVIILALQTAIFAVIWYRDYVFAHALDQPFFRRGNYVLIGIYAMLVFLFNKLYGGFRVGHFRRFDVLFSQVMAAACTNLFTYVVLCLIGRWGFADHMGPMILVMALDVLAIFLWVYVTKWAFMKIYPPRKMILVYGHYSTSLLTQKMEMRRDKYDIEESISIDRDIEEIKERISHYHNVVLTDIPSETRNKLLKYCFENNIRCYSVPKISDIMIRSAGKAHLFDTSLLVFRNQGLTIEQRAAKRAFDIVMALIFIVVSAPVMLIIALLIKLYDGGPVFFTQDRLTRDGKVFKLIKFRSMRVQQEGSEYVMTRKHDDRITPVGRVLRHIHFDELPQIYNILKGEMSFVGPRPECPKLAADYCKVVPEFDYRLKVKAGLTGYAQVYGKYNTTPYDKLKLDMTYIVNYSFLLDLKLVLLTFKVLFWKENTEGIESWQTSAATKENLEKMGEK